MICHSDKGDVSPFFFLINAMYKLIAVLSTVMATVGVVLLAVYISPYAIGLITIPALLSPFMLFDAFSK